MIKFYEYHAIQDYCFLQPIDNVCFMEQMFFEMKAQTDD
jgi:hypothetical protein